MIPHTLILLSLQYKAVFLSVAYPTQRATAEPIPALIMPSRKEEDEVEG